MSQIKLEGFEGRYERFDEDAAGPKQLTIRSDSVIVAIMIDGKGVGGQGGSETVNILLPSTGIITLYTVYQKTFLAFRKLIC